MRTVILGANGAGKSVLLRALHGLVPLAARHASPGRAGARPARSEAMVFQRPVMLRRSARSPTSSTRWRSRGVRGARSAARARARRSSASASRALAQAPGARALGRRAAAPRPRARLGAAARASSSSTSPPRASIRGATREVEREIGADPRRRHAHRHDHAPPRARRGASPTRSSSCTTGASPSRRAADRFFDAPAIRRRRPQFLKGELPWHRT